MIPAITDVSNSVVTESSERSCCWGGKVIENAWIDTTTSIARWYGLSDVSWAVEFVTSDEGIKEAVSS